MKKITSSPVLAEMNHQYGPRFEWPLLFYFYWICSKFSFVFHLLHHWRELRESLEVRYVHEKRKNWKLNPYISEECSLIFLGNPLSSFNGLLNNCIFLNQYAVTKLFVITKDWFPSYTSLPSSNPTLRRNN